MMPACLPTAGRSAFRAFRFSNYLRWFRSIHQDPVLEAFCERTLSLTISRQSIRRAQFDAIVPLTVFGIDIAYLTPEALLYYAMESRKYGVVSGEAGGDGCFAATQAWPLPLRATDHPTYLAWATEAFRLSTSGVRPDTQIHTHMCYAEFGDVVQAIDDLDADVISLEAARPHMQVASNSPPTATLARPDPASTTSTPPAFPARRRPPNCSERV